MEALYRTFRSEAHSGPKAARYTRGMSHPDRGDTESRLLRALPPPVETLARQLHAAGHAAFLVGGCVRDFLRGLAVHDFDLATSASAEQVLALFPRAIPIGLQHGTVMLPTAAGPVDITTFRAGPRLEDDLAHRDFTVNAIAFDLETGRLVDPWDGGADLAAGRLRAVGSAAERLSEDPLRALRGARLVATLGLAPDPSFEAALPRVRPLLAGVARERIRAELVALLLGPGAANGLSLLQRSGLAGLLAPGVLADAPAVVGALPPELPLRMAAWLRGTRTSAVLTALRFPRRLSQRVALLLRIHPIEAAADPESDTSVRRLLQRAGAENVAFLVALRRAELTAGTLAPGFDAPGSLARVAALERAIERVQAAGTLALHRLDLALDGRAVMQALGCRPGRTVGAALRYLTERVLEDPARNTPEALRALLLDWRTVGAARK
jgi:tRNA nucleotidyltransferase (CCA-adding enzyme)